MPGVSTDLLALTPGERRAAVLAFIRDARRHLVLTMRRCTDDAVLAALSGAIDRGVHVEVLVAQRTKGWRQAPDGLAGILTRMGAHVRRWHDPAVPYHAKLGVADADRAMVATLNYTRRSFETTVDAVLITRDAALVASIGDLFRADTEARPWAPAGQASTRLIVGPEALRSELAARFEAAGQSICILDRGFRDPSLRALVESRRADGITVTLLGARDVLPYTAHGRFIVLDGVVALIGSASLSPRSLEARREAAVTITEPALVQRVSALLRWAADHERGDRGWSIGADTQCGLASEP